MSNVDELYLDLPADFSKYRFSPVFETPIRKAIHPIDGMQPFVSGMSSWCVSIAFVRDGELQFGMIYRPPRDELFAGSRDRPATLNGRLIKLHPSMDIKHGFMGIGYSTRVTVGEFLPMFERVLNAGGMFYRDGSGPDALLRRLRKADRLRRTAHQFLGLPGRDRGDPCSGRHDQRLPGGYTACSRATPWSPVLQRCSRNSKHCSRAARSTGSISSPAGLLPGAKADSSVRCGPLDGIVSLFSRRILYRRRRAFTVRAQALVEVEATRSG